jgi:hypothetical protein
MRHADIQCLHGFAVEPACKPSNRLHHHHEYVLPVKANLLDDTEASTTSWESLWIDVGGEG